MIVVQVSDPNLRKAVRRAARPDEDVVTESSPALEALDSGFPRLVVRTEESHLGVVRPEVPLLLLDATKLGRWEVERRSEPVPPTRIDFATRKLEALIETHALERTWVDGAIAELTRAAGTQLPSGLRGFARRILEFPVRYTNLHALADASGISRGALKAKFRRRGLVSPFTYQQWFRVMAIAHILSDRSVTVATAAHRTGFTSDGNLCRMMASVCDMTPTQVRTVLGWNKLLVTFAWLHLTPHALDAWSDLEELFETRTA